MRFVTHVTIQVMLEVLENDMLSIQVYRRLALHQSCQSVRLRRISLSYRDPESFENVPQKPDILLLFLIALLDFGLQ